MSTRSGTIYNASTRMRKSRVQPSVPLTSTSTRPQRSTCTSFSAKLINEYCDSDNDSTSDYGSDDEVYFDTIDSIPKYEVNIDFDEASTAWRANKRRVGESWVYKLNPKHIRLDIVDDAIKSVASHVANVNANVNANASVADRVKQRHASSF